MSIPEWLRRALLLALMLYAASVQAGELRVGVLTMQPGEVFFERFGHNAIIVQDTGSGETVSYNFGYFDPDEPGFVGNFARGRMMYYLVALPLQQDLSYYRSVGRGVDVQWLDLEPARAQALAASLAERSRPENARYRYDYFTSNCSTQVRDALDAAMDGALKRQLSGRSRGITYRSESVRLASPSPWMWIGFDLGLSGYADRPLSRWDDAFIPMRLAESLDEAKNADGQPLVAAREQLLPQRLPPEPPAQARRWWPWLLAGLAIACGLLLLRHRPRLVAALALALWLLCGIGGALLAWLWGFSAHQAAWANQNLLLLNPLCLLLLPGGIGALAGRSPGKMFRWLLAIVAALSVLAWLLHWLPTYPQLNQAWIGLLSPIHIALSMIWSRRQANN
ncbi:DUF4105 domain-containing protein [Pseudoxanthomonas kalamensis]|uniref:lipoprotein N-acyltransferase Lnb domain-containing protein n=1 Tax=Pseudoxanthomonas kalamensis TaxID=289483 RepID=UPI003CCCAFAF